MLCIGFPIVAYLAMSSDDRPSHFNLGETRLILSKDIALEPCGSASTRQRIGILLNMITLSRGWAGMPSRKDGLVRQLIAQSANQLPCRDIRVTFACNEYRFAEYTVFGKSIAAQGLKDGLVPWAHPRAYSIYGSN
jgi:hypothetical protein